MKRKLILLLSFVALMTTLPIRAFESSITSGSYYRLYNATYTTRCMDGAGGVVAGVAADASSYSQMWKITKSGSTYTFQNVLTNQYIQAARGTSVQFLTGTSSVNFTGITSGSGTSTKFAFYSGSGTSSYTALHCADTQNYNVVGWQATAEASYWQVEKVTLTSAQQTELDNIHSFLSNDYTSQLTTFFDDYACTTLKSNYASMTDANLRSAMSSLPTAIQDMAVCVKNSTWNSSKGSTWNEYEKDFRIHSYEIFSNCDLWYDKLKIGKFSHLFHPTGVKVSTGDYVYIYVGADVADSNASLEAEIVSGCDREGATFTLHKGYNAIYAPKSGEVFVSYLLNNVDKSCTSYPNITVHIEGGTMNGCFDMRGHGHTNDDWAWLKSNMFSDTYLHVKGNSVLLNVYLASVTGESNAVGVMNIWDFIFDKLQSLSGCDSYKASGKYKMMVNPFDNGTTGTNPFWNNGNHGSSHPGITSSGIFSYNNLSNVGTDGGQIWEIAHELAHGHQTPVNMAGQTESSNNSLVQCLNLLASENVGTNMFQSVRSSRGDGVKALVSRFNSGYSWIDIASIRTQSTYDDLWLGNKLLFQLWLYFDYLGNYQPAGGNTGFSFISALYDKMRTNGMVHSANSSSPGLASKDYLLLAQYAAEITQTDLSEYFEAWGFWKLEPTVSNSSDIASSSTWYMSDYNGYYVKTAQSYVDAVKNAMKSYTKKGGNIMFIEDRCTGSTLPTYNGKGVATFGETGYYGTYSQKITTPYSFSTSYSGYGSNRTYSVTMAGGTGAVGFKVYDASGNLVAISNTATFTVSQDIYNGLKNGTYTVKAAQGDGADIASDAQGVTYLLKFGDTVLAEDGFLLSPGTVTKDYIPAVFSASIEPYEGWAELECDPAVTTAATTQVNVNIIWKGPFQFSTDFSSARWYTLNGHSSYNNLYISTDGDNIVWSQGRGTTDAYKWAFMGNPVEGVKLVNKATGATKYLNNTDPATMSTTEYAWVLKKQNNSSVSGYAGSNGFGFWDETLTYLNTQGSTLKYWGAFDQGSTYWVTDDVSDYLPGVTSLSNLSNNKVYLVTNARGTWTVATDSASNMSTAGFLLTDYKQQFAIIKYEDHYYLYNVALQKFLGSANTFTETPEAVNITATNNATYPWFFSFDSSHNINVNGAGTVLIDTWSTIDSGNSNAIIEAADFDSADAIAMLDAYFHPTATVTYVLSDANGVIYTSDAIPSTPGAVITALPDELKRPFCSYSAINQTLANGENTINVTVTYDAPFDAALNTDKLYYATLRNHYVYYDATNNDVRTNQTSKETTDAYKWSFYGNPYDGIKVKNAATGTYLDNTATTVQLTATGYAWTLHRLNNTTTFGLYNGSNHINEQNHTNHNLIYWWDFDTDTGSQWNIEEVPVGVIQVTYNLVIGGTTVLTEVNAEVQPNSAVEIPASFTSAYSPLAYDFTTSGTIGTSNSTITVTATLKAGVVTDLNNLSNSKAYLLTTERGSLASDGTQMASTNGTSLTASNFAIINYEGLLFLYSVADSKWVGNPTTVNEVGGQPALTTDLANVTPITLDNTGLASPLYFMGMGSNGVNVATGYGTGIVVNSWTTRDGGNQYCIIEAADFDATAALAALEEVYGNAYDNVAAEILPYIFDDPTDIDNSDPETHIGQLFAISATGATNFISTYQTQLTNRHFTLSEYRAAKALLEANILYPEEGKTYLVKNVSNNMYLRVAQHGTRGQVFADLTAAEAAADALAHFTIKVENNLPYMGTDGHYFNWTYADYDGNEAYTIETAEALDKYVHFVSVRPGVGAFSLALGNGENGYEGYLDPGFYGLKNGTTTIGGSTTTPGYASEYAQWIFEEYSALVGDVNHDGAVNNLDIRILVRILTGHETDENGDPYDMDAANVNGDAAGVTLADLTMLINIYNE